MDFLKNIEWFINSHPKTATNRENLNNLSKKELDMIVFEDDSLKKLSFPLNDNYSFFVTREISCPVTINNLLTFVYKFYQEPLNPEILDKAFEGMEEWKQEIFEYYDEDFTKFINFDVFTNTCEPDFCGLELNEETGEYTVHIGPK